MFYSSLDPELFEEDNEDTTISLPDKFLNKQYDKDLKRNTNQLRRTPK